MNKKLLLLLAGCVVMFGCKSADEPQTSTGEPQNEKMITEQVLKSYFPYKNGDRIVYFNDLIGDMNYTVVESAFRNESDKMILSVNMFGYDVMGNQLCILSLVGEVTEKHLLKIEYTQGLNNSPSENSVQQLNNVPSSTSGSFVFKKKKKGNLPATITLSDGSIIKQNEGLTYFIDFDTEKWYFKKRL